MKNRPVDYLRFGFFLGLQGSHLAAGARNQGRVLGSSEKIPMPDRRLRNTVFSHFAVELIRVVRGFAGRRRAVEKPGELLRNVAVSTVVSLYALFLVRRLICKGKKEV